jgi:hypothetical protein
MSVRMPESSNFESRLFLCVPVVFMNHKEIRDCKSRILTAGCVGNPMVSSVSSDIIEADSDIAVSEPAAASSKANSITLP